MSHPSPYLISKFLQNSSGALIDSALDFTSAPNTSDSAREFVITPPTGQEYVIQRIIGSMRSGPSPLGSEYGSASALTSGVQIFVDRGSSDDKVFLLTEANGWIKTNDMWSAYCYDMQRVLAGTSVSSLNWRWTFAKYSQASDKDPGIHLDYGERLVCRFVDDLSGLTAHAIMAQGFIGNRNYL